ncbi:MAG TPA: hypothetical protein VF516_46975 [Kofleriaceae bacterium]
MRARLIVLAALLCAVPATGSDIDLTQAQVDALTVVDAPPSREDIDLAFSSSPSPNPGLDALLALAVDTSQDLGLQIRAIRALPQYCLPTGCAGSPVHDKLVVIVGDFRDQLGRGPLSPKDLLRLRAAMEALGATRSGLQDDVDLLTAQVLLQHPSRDVQVTVVHALQSLCSPDLCPHDACVQDANAVRALRTGTDTQVDAAINRALAELARCAQP